MSTAPNLDEIWSNQKKYVGFTAQEYMANPEKYRWNYSKFMGMVDASTQELKEFIKTQVYYMNGIKCDSLEQCERVARDEGLNLFTDCDLDIQQTEISRGELKYIVNFKRKLKLI